MTHHIPITAILTGAGKRGVSILSLVLLLLLCLAGCQRFPTPAPTQAGASATPGQVAGTGVALTPDSLPSPTALLPPASPSPGAIPATDAPVLTPTPLPLSQDPITPANVASLRKAGEIRYAPWGLVMAIAWSQDGARLAVAAGETIHIYDGQTLEQVQALAVGAWANSLAFLPGETGAEWVALVSKDGSLQFWEIATAQRLCRIEAHLKGANSLALSPDGRYVGSTGNDGIVRLWEVAPLLQSGVCPEQPFAEMIGGAFAVSDVAFNPAGGVVAAANANIIHLRDPATQRLIRTLYGEGSIFSIAYRPDGRWLAAAEMGGSARLWDGETGEVLAVLDRPEDYPPPEGGFLWSVAFNHDGSVLAGGASDGLLLLWDLSLEPAPPGLAFAGHARAVTSLAFSPAGSRLATGSLDGSVLLWGIP